MTAATWKKIAADANLFDHLAVTKTAWQNEKVAGVVSSDLRPIWLPAMDTLRNLICVPLEEMNMTFDLLRHTAVAG